MFCTFFEAILWIRVNKSAFSLAALAWKIMESFSGRICEAFTLLCQKWKLTRTFFMLKLLDFSGIPPYGSVRLGVNYCAAVEHVGWHCLKANVVTIQSSGYRSPWVNMFADLLCQEFARWFVAIVQSRSCSQTSGEKVCVILFFIYCEKMTVKWQWKMTVVFSMEVVK